MTTKSNFEKLAVAAAAVACIVAGAAQAEQAHAQGVYTVRCLDADGNLKWEDTIHNLITTVGGNDMLDKYFAGSAYTAAFYLGLMSSVSYTTGAVLADTMASHGGWTEAGGTNAPTYSQSARPTAAWASASAKSKALSSALSYSITSAGTVKGCFLTTVATKDGTTGILFSAGVFTNGDKVVANLDTLQVSYACGV